MSDAPELLPCPFCGGEPEWKSGGPGCAWISCKQCPAETGDGSIQRIITAWNTRTPDPRVAAMVAAARRALSEAVADEMDPWFADLRAAIAAQEAGNV